MTMFHIASTASPAGPIVFSVFALLVISLVVLLILRYYLPLRTTPGFYLVPIFFALWLPSVLVLLVPIDLASTAKTDDEATRGVWLPQRLILVAWRITYWLTFSLTWFILPILAEYADSGYREPKDKFLYSLRENAQFHAIVLGLTGVSLIYVVVAHGITVTSLKAPIMALAYCWGLILAIYLMGHGLVSIPRQLIRNASLSGRLRRLQKRAPGVHERMEESIANLEEIEVQVAELGRRKTGSALQFEDWIQELQDMVSLLEQRPGGALGATAAAAAAAGSRIIPTVITEKFLADLTRKLNRARHARSRYVDEWNRLVREAARTQAILDSAASKKLDFGEGTAPSGIWARTTSLSPHARYLIFYQIAPYAQAFLGGFLALASFCIVWSEVCKFALPMLSVIRVSVIHHWVGDKAQVGFAGQLISAFWLCYMCAAALISMTEVKVWRGRALVKRNTAHESAFWYAMQVAKLSVPLSYNFMTMLSNRVYTKSIFYQFLGKQIDLTAAGRWIDDLFPILVLFPVIATLFGFYGKVKRLFVGWDVMDDEEENPSGYGTGSWREGRDLIDRELGGSSLFRHREEAIGRLTAGRSAPVLTIPSAGSAASRSPTRASTGVGAGARRAGQSSRAPLLDEPEDDNLFTIIGHRMKNTIDTIETPKWMQDFGQGIKKPKWMGGDDDNNNDQLPGAGAGGSSSNSGPDFRRWFGGGDSGQIRL
jgi:hypothetical protein